MGQDLTKKLASERLQSLNVNSHTSCYVNPNAKCPVCGGTVFFYANGYGSRVYFDDLGPPWPKHACTDTSRTQTTSRFVGPSPRSSSQISEIITVARDAEKTFARAPRKKNKRWVLHVVIEASFKNHQLHIAAESLTEKNRESINFHVLCAEKILDDGDLLSRRGHVFSFVRRDTLEAIDVVDGQMVGAIENGEPTVDSERIPESAEEIDPMERRHFHCAAVSQEELLREYKPILLNFTNRNIVGPILVTHYLNASGHTTACGEQWTPRLSFFLISLLGEPTDREVRRKNKPTRKTQTKTSRTKKAELEDFASFSTDANDPKSWAKKLARLGRVTRRSDYDN